MFSNKILYKIAILSTLVLTYGILSNGGNLVQAQTPPAPVSPPGGAVGTITTPTTAIPSNNVTALHVYDNSTMVLEFGNGTTLASPYSNVWSISFSPASNQTIGNIPIGVGAPPVATTTPPPGVMTPPPPATNAPPVATTTPPPGVAAPPPGGA